MRRWMLDAPRWVLALVAGIPIGLSNALSTRFVQGAGWTDALVHGAIAGLFSGAVVGVVLHRKNRQVRRAVGELSDTQLKYATRAGWRGPVPEDAATREAAHRLLVSELAQVRRQRVWAVPFYLLMMGAGAFAAVTSGPGWWVVVGLLGALLLGGHGYLPRHLRRRLELLEAVPQR